MITSLSAKGFKCLDGQKFRLGQLTLLTGINGAGKSSVIQSLLLARIAALASSEVRAIVPLNGPFNLALGQVIDVISYWSETKSEIVITVEYDGKPAHLSLLADASSDRYLRIDYSDAGISALSNPQLGQFTYLSAEREGPRDFQATQSAPKDMLELGARGEFVADVLQAYEREQVLSGLEHPRAAGLRLGKQVEAWLGAFISDLEVRVETALGIGVAAVRFKHGGASSEWLRPPNIGFGITHSLPVVLAGLLAKPQSLLVVDSPEAHLHPAAQSAMGGFLGRVAAAGVQVLVETHSDHVLNGIRLAVVDDSHPLRPQDVVIHYLMMTETALFSEPIIISSRGSLSHHPTNFFDQAEKDIAGIIRHRRPKRPED
jgi:predicted ATPase